MEFKIVETIGTFSGCNYNIAMWRGTMCLHVCSKACIKGKTIEEVVALLKPYGITKDETTIVYNKINGGK